MNLPRHDFSLLTIENNYSIPAGIGISVILNGLACWSRFMSIQKSAHQSDNTKKRFHPRVNVDLKTDFQVLRKAIGSDNCSPRVDTTAKTLGTGGVMFVSNIPLTVGTKVDMKLHYYSITIEFVAEVVWTEERAGFNTPEFYCGSRYSAISYDNLTHIQNIIRSQRIQ